jgi:hypothetical protein
MTELQMGLIALGATAVAGVYSYNKWQESRHRKVAESVLRPDHDDVLLGEASTVAKRSEPEMRPDEPQLVAAERLEPMLDSGLVDEPVLAVEPSEPMFVEPPLTPERREPVVSTPPPSADVVSPAVQPISKPVVDVPVAAAQPVEHGEYEHPVGEVPLELLDPRTEFIAAMELVEAVPAQQILQSQGEALQQVSKPIHWVAFNERSAEWIRLPADSDMAVRHLRVGLQLVNRLGPVSDAELATFAGAMQVLADELMAVAVMPSTRVRDQAAELDTFCASVDLEIGVNLISRGPAFSGTKIRALAEAAGMVLGVDGLFTRYDEAGHAQFCLQNFETAQFAAESIRTMATHGLTFLLDVPRVDHGERVFQQMTELARRFADTLQGILVDDNRRPLGEPQLDHIRREFVGKPQATMAAYGLPAGSPQALRLFS